ncbi:MAG: hypothetical protein M3O88_00780, partial [Actinomycetota bacterium]|nr:hypothetical protein [Actinomycetota bacterium]
RFDFAPGAEGAEPELGEVSVVPELGAGSDEEETAPDLMENLREALMRSKANAVWGPDLEWSGEAPPQPPFADKEASIDEAAEHAESFAGDGTPSDEGELVPEPPDPPDPEATAHEKPIPAPSAESPAEQATQAVAMDGERSEPSPASLEDETLSLTERELRQYAEQRSEFEERLREFWKDADGERDETSDNQDERKLPFAGIWKRDRKT